MARPTRDVRPTALNVANLNAGDGIMLVVVVLLFVALVFNWWVSGQGVNAVKFSELYFVVVLILILVTIGLIVYPMIQSEAGIRPLPFATPPVLLLVGFVILLTTTYELGRYDAVGTTTVSAGFGLWLAFVCSWLYLVGALIKWSSRERALKS